MENEEKPPVFSTWNQLYLFVLLHLAILIALFYMITKYFA
jgi:hypothetical protein